MTTTVSTAFDQPTPLPHIPGYTVLETLYTGTKTMVYRARSAESTPVVIKVLAATHPSCSELSVLRHQFNIAQSLPIPGIVTPITLEPWRNGYALVVEDFGGISLSQYVKAQTLSLIECLSIASQMADILQGLSEYNIVHKDIKPANILIHPDSKRIQLIDFSIATRLPKETQKIQPPSVLEGTLAYIAPEQTGRMNRRIDYRSDFYGLGVTLYRLLTGVLPFVKTDPLELIHCHMAKAPVPPHEVKAAIPVMVSEIVLKLMAKNAEDRYQSAIGLKHDLTECLTQIKTTGEVSRFELGEKDVRDRFLIPEKLYGREADVTTLLTAFERASSGTSELLLVTGVSGMGKTALVSEVHKSLTRQHGYFIKGKFDQFNRNIPFSAWVQAFRGLMGQLLGESDEQLAKWKRKILTAVGENGQVLIDVIPELETIIGEQPAVVALTGKESQNRFNGLFNRFVRIFATGSHPLVIFLDDLQWADSASLSALSLLFNESKLNEVGSGANAGHFLGHFLVVGAYRDNEVFPAHPLVQTLKQLENNHLSIESITLSPLSEADVTSLVMESLRCEIALGQTLGKLIHQKTQGNPFFTTQFLQALHTQSCIYFEPHLGKWQCDMQKVQTLALTEDADTSDEAHDTQKEEVVAFMVGRLRKLPEATQKALKIAACIGNRFNLETLAAVCDRLPAQMAEDLWPALQENLVVPENDSYKFLQKTDSPQSVTSNAIGNPASQQSNSKSNQSNQTQSNQTQSNQTQDNQTQGNEPLNVIYHFLHDRVQQAAYAIISPEKRQSVHLKIGQRLLKNIPPEAREKHLFDLVGQLNMGRALLQTAAERQYLSQLNLQAGKKAKLATAYGPALEYFAIAQTLLPSNSWEQDYETTLEIFVEALETEYLATHFESIEALSAPILEQTQNLLDIIKVHEIRIRAWIGLGNQHQALKIGLEVLNQLGIQLLDNPPSVVNDIASLIDAPVMSDPRQLAAMQIMASIITSAWAVSPDDFPRLTFTMVALSMQHGNAPASPFGYAWHGAILCEALGDATTGQAFGKLAVVLLDKLNVQSLRSKVLNIYASTISLWQGPVTASFESHLAGIQSGLDSGDFEFAGYNAAEYSQYLFLAGTSLEKVKETCEQNLLLIEHLKQDFHQQYLAPWLQAALNLTKTDSAAEGCITELEGEIYSEKASLPAAVEQQQLTLVFVTYLLKSLLSYVFGKYDLALEYGKAAQAHNEGVSGTLFIPTEMFYVSLARLACLDTMDEYQAKTARKQVDADLAQLRHWAKTAPMNYQHKCDLIAAECARCDRQFLTAIDLYEQAITGAKNNGYLQEEALANERAAQFYLSWHKEKMAIGYLQAAYYGYSHWGAVAKTKALEQQYPHLLQKSHPLQAASSTAASTLNPLDTIASLAAPNLLSRASGSTFSATATTTTYSTRSSSTFINTSLDLATILKAAQALSSTIELKELLRQLTGIILQNSGGDRCALILENNDGQWQIESLATPDETELLSVPLEAAAIARSEESPLQETVHLPVKLIHYVKNTQKTVVIDNLETQLPVIDSYLNEQRPKSVLCLPLLTQGQLLGVLYLQNQAISHTFSPQRIMVLSFLCAQAAIALKNARLYQQAQTYAQQAQTYAQQVENSQLQTVQNEKMASLGNLVAGVAHEINNPIGFLNGSVKNAQRYLQDLLEHLELYQQTYPEADNDIADNADDIDIDFICEDFPKLLNSMQSANKRIKEISTSLRTFSRADTEHKVSADLHQGLDSTLLILKYRLKASEQRPAITVTKQYDEQLGAVECFPGQLNQVFMNLLANAIDMFDEVAQTSSASDLAEHPQVITVTTRPHQDGVEIRIADNGKGIPETVKERIFDRLFTTKSVGKGTGLGLAIARQIIEERHNGQLIVNSTIGEGTEFCIHLPRT